MEKAIIVNDITKKYKLYDNTKDRLLDLVSPKNFGEDFYALANVNFEANHGEVVGFVGINGSGKTTLSNIIAGIVPETSGSVKVNGQVSLIAVAAGLKNDLTGRDNIELKLLMLGFSRKEIQALEPDIIEFSELGKFIDQPVKSYSSGMKSRLGFSISVNIDPDILIIDEALSVGDKAFAEKSLNKMNEFKSEGKTMIFVSHSIGQMKKFCEKVLWLEFGMVRDYGDVDEIIPKYESFLKKWQMMKKQEREIYKEKALENQMQILKGEKIKYDFNSELEAYKKESSNTDYNEKPVSLLSHFRAKESLIYPSIENNIKGASTDELKEKVYYVKKQATYNGELFYLVSVKPSTVQGVIGWVEASNLSTNKHIIVDFDIKEFYLNGNGKAYINPWGGKRDCIIDNLSPYEGDKIKVTETNLVGNNTWYKCKIQGRQAWVHQNFLSEGI